MTAAFQLFQLLIQVGFERYHTLTRSLCSFYFFHFAFRVERSPDGGFTFGRRLDPIDATLLLLIVVSLLSRVRRHCKDRLTLLTMNIRQRLNSQTIHIMH